MFFGSITALVTPMDGAGLDETSLRGLVDHQISAGSDGLVACGTTGEVATLRHAEWMQVVRAVTEGARGRVPVIAGAGSYDTAASIERAQIAKDVGCDGILVVTPYYNRPGQEGLIAHFTAIADAVAIPMILYNVPGRTGIDMSADTVAQLSTHPNIVGIKDATADMKRMSQHRANCAEGFIFLSGDDASSLGFNAHGGHGAISVTSNIAPADCAAFQRACREGRWDEARDLHDRLMPWHEMLFASPSPGPAKWVLAELGRMKADMRLPLVSPPPAVQERLAAGLRDHRPH